MVALSHRGALQQTTVLSSLLLFSLLFCYFIFSPAEQIHLVVGIYKPKIGHIFALILLVWMILQRWVWKIERRMLIAFSLILISLLLSALFGAAPKRSLGYLGIYLFNFAVYFFLPFQIMQKIDLQRFFRIYWSSFVVVGLYALSQILLSIIGIYDPLALQRVGRFARGQAWTYEPSYYALYMIPYVMFYNAKALFREKIGYPFKRRFKLFCQNMLITISTSTGLIISYPVFFLTTLLKMTNPLHRVAKREMKKALLAFMGTLFALTALFYEVVIHSFFKFFYFGFLNHFSFQARWDGIIASCETFFRHPLLGAGLGGVSAEKFRELSVYDDKIETLIEFEGYDPTNCFTEVLASLGVVGLLAFIYLGLVFYRSFQDVMKDAAIDSESKKVATALFISLVVMIIALQMNQGLFRPYVWIHAAVVYGYFQRIKTSSFSSEPSQPS